VLTGPARQIVKTEYIKQQVPEPPAEPAYYTVTWQAGDGRYCLDPENAKNLLKNTEIMKANKNEMRGILIDLRGAK
jgi:hypothetical protein